MIVSSNKYPTWHVPVGFLLDGIITLMRELGARFLTSVCTLPEYRAAMSVVRENSKANLWLIGGFVFRTLAADLYGIAKPVVDLDFIVEEPVRRLRVPRGWTKAQNSFGNPKFVRNDDGFSFDFVPLKNIHSIQSRVIEPTIDNYLSGTPLTVQSIAYDVNSIRLLGEVGMKALDERTVGVHNLEEAEAYARRYEITVNQYIQEKAKSLGFTPIFI